MQIYFGKKFYSNYFGCECIVLQVINDDLWFFVTAKQPTHVKKAQAKFSEIFIEERKLHLVKGKKNK